MPRRARRDAPGAIHHLLLRGIERRPIFIDDWDREDFVTRLERIAVECGAHCLAFALMTNHIHIAVRTGPHAIAELMHRLLTGYARRFNHRHGRCGHLFGNRYGSLLVDDDAYLRTLVRYIHLNPVRAGLVGSLAALARHPWTGHAALMLGGRPFQAVDEVLRWFAPDPDLARRRLLAWMREGLAEDRGSLERWRPDPAPPPAVRGGVLLPEPCFRPNVRALAEPVPTPLRLRANGWNLDRLIAWVCAETGADPPSLRVGARKRCVSRARALVGHFGTRVLGARVLEVSRACGVSPGAISRSLRRGAAIGSELGLVLPERPPR